MNALLRLFVRPHQPLRAIVATQSESRETARAAAKVRRSMEAAVARLSEDQRRAAIARASVRQGEGA